MEQGSINISPEYYNNDYDDAKYANYNLEDDSDEDMANELDY